MGVSSCCKRCNDCDNCYDHSISKLQDVLYAVNHKLSDNLEQQVCEMRWGYSQKRPLAKEKLYVYRRTISDHIKALRNGYPTCLCPQEFQIILEDAQRLVGLSCCKDPQRRDLIIDKSGLEAWTLLNTGCVTYDEWEKTFTKACPNIGIKVQKAGTLEEACKLFYVLSTSTYDSCAVLFNIKAATIAIQQNCYDVAWTATPLTCDLSILSKVRRVELDKCLTYGLTTEQVVECKISYDAMVRQTKCKMDFGTYIDLLSCHLTTDVITRLVQCGVDVSYNAKKLCPELKFGKNVVHLYDDLDLTNLTEDIFSCDFQILDANGDEP